MYSNFLASSFDNGPGHGIPTAGDNGSGGNANVMAMMNEQEAVGLLQHLDKTELEHLLNNDTKLKDLVNSLDQVRRLQAKHDNLVATNKSLAEYNLSQQPKLESLKHEVASHYQQLNELKTTVVENKTKLDGFFGNQKLDTVHALLQTETAKAEEECEELADKFCEDGDIEGFLSSFLQQRSLAHKRRVKTERFAELIHQQGRGINNHSGQTSHPGQHHTQHHTPMVMSPTYQNHSSSASFTTAAAPYPTSGPYGMPQPNLFQR